MALSGKSSGMSFAEWVKKKKEGETSSPSAPSSSSETSAKSNTNDSSLKGKSSGISFDEWIKKKRASSIGSSFEDWGNEANSLINEINNFHKTWHSEDDEAYTSYEDRISKLFVAANDWRSKYSSDEKTISYINDVVSRLEKLQDYNHEYKSQYSKYKTEDEYKKAVKGQENYEAMVKFDLVAGQKEIDELEKKLCKCVAFKIAKFILGFAIPNSLLNIIKILFSFFLSPGSIIVVINGYLFIG